MACETVGISSRTYERWCTGDHVKMDLRPIIKRSSPSNKLTENEYKSVLKVLALPEYADLPPSQIVPALADRGKYIASESTMYRILKKEKMQNHRGYARIPKKIKVPETHVSNNPNQVWTWDITYLSTLVIGVYFKLYMIVDIFSRKIVGWEVWETETGEFASILVEKAIMNEKIKGKLLILHSDNGGPMKSYTLKAKLEELGVMSSFSRPRVSNDNPYSEALFRTCKYKSSYPQEGFKTIADAREWVLEFVDWYNNRHYHSGLNFVTPSSRHKGLAPKIMKKRLKVYKAAKELHPQRFNRGIRNWDLPETVSLNPRKSEDKTI
jgi:putative transposase